MLIGELQLEANLSLEALHEITVSMAIAIRSEGNSCDVAMIIRVPYLDDVEFQNHRDRSTDFAL